MTDISKKAVEVLVSTIVGRSPNNTDHDQTRAARTLLALQARVEELEASNEALSEYSFEATKAIVGLTAGGSEFFAGKLPDGRYKADLSRCVKYVRDTKETLHNQVKRQHERGRLQGLDEAIKRLRKEWNTPITRKHIAAIEALKEQDND